MTLQFDDQSKQFVVIDDNGYKLEIPFPFPIQRGGQTFLFRQDAPYTIETWHHSDVAESDSYSVYVKGDDGQGDYRIGWVIPYEALISTEHDTAKNEHFWEYAFNAYIKLIQEQSISDRLSAGESFKEIISDIYECDNAVLFISEDALLRNGLDIKSLTLSFFRNGFYSQVAFKNEKITKPNPNIGEPKIVLHQTGLVYDPVEEKYLNEYIRDFLKLHPSDENQFIRFFYLYQLIEVLFDDYLVANLSSLIDGINEGTKSVRQLNDELRNTTESKRFSEIFRKAGLREEDYADLKDLCRTFLPEGVVKEEDGITEYVYQVRNRIIHRFRLVSSDEEAIKKINDSLFIFLLDLLINYKR